MTEHKQATRERVLQAACRIFAEKGFRDATVAEICEAAEANIAAVNYHFGDKETLYDEVWKHAYGLASEAHPLNDRRQDHPTAEDLLYRYANAILHRIFSEDETGLFAKLLCREMAAPTLALNKVASDYLLPQNRQLDSVIKDLVGSDADEAVLALCKHSIIGQCAFYNFSRPLRKKMIGKPTMTEDEIEQAARHIARFSLAGLQAVRHPL